MGLGPTKMNLSRLYSAFLYHMPIHSYTLPSLVDIRISRILGSGQIAEGSPFRSSATTGSIRIGATAVGPKYQAPYRQICSLVGPFERHQIGSLQIDLSEKQKAFDSFAVMQRTALIRQRPKPRKTNGERKVRHKSRLKAEAALPRTRRRMVLYRRRPG
jgi:hypothetical protein